MFLLLVFVSSILLQFLPVALSSFPVAPACSRWFQPIHCFETLSSASFSYFHLVSACSIMFQVIPGVFRLVFYIFKSQRQSQVFKNLKNYETVVTNIILIFKPELFLYRGAKFYISRTSVATFT